MPYAWYSLLFVLHIYLSNKYLLRATDLPGTVLGTRDTRPSTIGKGEGERPRQQLNIL